jgi:hypothetical protein
MASWIAENWWYVVCYTHDREVSKRLLNWHKAGKSIEQATEEAIEQPIRDRR